MAFGFAQPFQSHLGQIGQRLQMQGAQQQQQQAATRVDPFSYENKFPALPATATAPQPAAKPAQEAPAAATDAPAAPSIAAGGAGPSTAPADASAADGPDIADIISAVFGG